ncbi:hypothetical protein BB561_006845, partial [Smittium simulii]
KLPLAIKWPNDLYCISKENAENSPTLKKLGGTLVNSFSNNDHILLIIGTGINVANSLPTASINQLIDEYNFKNSTRIPKISMEEILAFLKNYTINTGYILVTLKNHDYDKVKIIGISTQNGYLIAESLDSTKKKYELHPNGNSFDMTSGLIGQKS